MLPLTNAPTSMLMTLKLSRYSCVPKEAKAAVHNVCGAIGVHKQRRKLCGE